MLDVLSRSQRARVCEYKRNESKMVTPCVVRSDVDSDVRVRTSGDDRILQIMGAEVVLESGLRTTSNSGMKSDVEVKDGIAVVRLPLPEELVFDDSVEIVVVPNAYELRKDPRRIVDNVIKLRTAAGFNRLLYLSGLGEPSTLALLTYIGVDMFDDTLPRAAGISGIRLIPEAEIATGEDESEHNIEAMEQEIEKIRMFIKSDRLRELADQRAPSTPTSVALLRLYDDVGYEYAEETCSFVGCRFSCNTTQALRRPDI